MAGFGLAWPSIERNNIFVFFFFLEWVDEYASNDGFYSSFVRWLLVLFFSFIGICIDIQVKL